MTRTQVPSQLSSEPAAPAACEDTEALVAVRHCSTSNTIVYSAIIGGRDAPRDDILTFSAYDRFLHPAMNAKIYKVLPHLFLDCEWSIWVDGNIDVQADVEELVALAQGHQIAVFPHRDRNCIYDEAEVCIERGLDDPEIIRRQIRRYRAAGYPAQNGMAECGVLIRRHSPRMRWLCEQWWAEICAGSMRDQISFPYVFQDYFRLRGTVFENEWFRYRSHAQPEPTAFERLSQYTRRMTRKVMRRTASIAPPGPR